MLVVDSECASHTQIHYHHVTLITVITMWQILIVTGFLTIDDTILHKPNMLENILSHLGDDLSKICKKKNNQTLILKLKIFDFPFSKIFPFKISGVVWSYF